MKRETSKTLNIVLNKRVETCIRYFYFIALMLLLTHSAFAQTQASVVQPDSIIPRPKLITEASTSEFVHLDSRWSIYTDLASEPDVFAAQYLKDKLLEQSGGALALEVKALPKTDEIPAQAILIGNPKDDALLQQAALAEGIADIDQTLSSDKYNEGYVLAVRPASILILGRSAAGRFYGVVTLRWLAEAPLPAGSTAIPPRSLLLPNVKITDWPEMKIRGFYGGINAAVPRLNRPLDTSKLDDRLAWIDELTRYKMNFWADLIERVDPQITAGNIAFPQTASPEVGEKLIIRNFAKARYFLISVSLPPSIVAQADPNLYEGVAAEKVPFRWSPQTINGQVAYLAAPNPAMDSIVLPSLQCKGFETQEHCLDNSEWSFGADSLRGSWTIDNSQAITGAAAAKLSLTDEQCDAAAQSAALKSKAFALVPNHVYHLSFYAKAEAADSCVHYPRVLAALDIPGRTAIVRTADIALGKGWQQYYLTFTYASDEPLAATAVFSIAAEITGSGKAAMWLDELQLDDLTYKLRNVLITPSTSVEVWNDAGTIRYREGVDYELMHTPGKEISLRNPMRGRETRIKRLGSAIGSRFRVSYDYAVNFQQHKNEEISFSEPRSLELYNKWLKANVDYFQPDFILVGLDELRSINRDSRSKKRGLPNYEVLSSFINQVNSSLQALRPGTRMLVWDDMLNPSHNGKIEDYQVPYGGQAGTTWPALQLIDRQVMPIVWWYRDADYHHKMRESKIFPEFGFEFIAAAGGVRLLNPDWWSYLVHTYGGSGMIMFEARGNEIPGLEQTARYAWTTRKTYGRQCYKWAIEMCDTTLTKPGRDEDCNNYEVIGGSLKTFDTYVDEDFDFQNDMLNCGYCSNHCFYANGIGACSAGKCSLDKCLNGYFDADGNPDNGCEAHDACPNDPAKTGPGACGCGVADTDSDGDSQPDCLDQCPADPAKTHPGACGCGAPENDSDGDGSADCTDLCPDDALKTEPGSCGCGIADSDSDNDTRPDCLDQCPENPAKAAPGACGCRALDTDSDADGTPDCLDQCPNDAKKVEAGQCGCGFEEEDSDGDLKIDCGAGDSGGCPSGQTADCALEKLPRSACVGANGFLGQVNISTVINLLAIPLDVELRYADAAGIIQGQVRTSIRPSGKWDYSIALLGLKPETYGTVCVETSAAVEGAWTGGITLYKPAAAQSGDYDFALYYPFTKPQTGVRAVPLNTFHLGVDSRDPVANWISISDAVPGDGHGLKGRLRYFDLSGALLKQEAVNIPDGGRLDYAGHSGIGGGAGDAAGTAVFVPQSEMFSAYYLTVTRYFYDCGGASCTNFLAAMNIPYRPAADAELWGSLSSVAGELSVLELSNSAAAAAQVQVTVFDAAGFVLRDETYQVPPFSSRHLIMNRDGQNGAIYAETTAAVRTMTHQGQVSPIVFQYKLDWRGQLAYAYALPLTGSREALQLSQFNSFIGHANTVEVANAAGCRIAFTLDVIDSAGKYLVRNSRYSVAAHGITRIPLYLQPDKYGTVILQADRDGLLSRTLISRRGQYVISLLGE